jgi:hypothetical protein
MLRWIELGVRLASLIVPVDFLLRQRAAIVLRYQGDDPPLGGAVPPLDYVAWLGRPSRFL